MIKLKHINLGNRNTTVTHETIKTTTRVVNIKTPPDMLENMACAEKSYIIGEYSQLCSCGEKIVFHNTDLCETKQVRRLKWFRSTLMWVELTYKYKCKCGDTFSTTLALH